MKKLLFCIVSIFLAWGILPAQEAIIADSGLTPAFEGSIMYKISWSGKEVKEVKALLPDSLVLSFSPPYIHAAYFGGISSTLLSEYMWSVEEGEAYLMDREAKKLYTLPTDQKVGEYKALKRDEKIKFLDYDCRKFQLKTEKGQAQVWVSEEIWFPRYETPSDSSDSLRTSRPPFLMAGIKGIPLKQLRTTEVGTSTMVVKEIRKGETSPGNFFLPEGMEKIPFDRYSLRYPLIQK